jgi:DNA recombination protein RmuC
MLTALSLLLVVAALGGLALWLTRAFAQLRSDSGAQLGERNAEVDRRLQGIVETMDRRLGELDRKVDGRLENATKTTTQVHERLVKLDQANAQMLERARELTRLEQALRPPKSRGGFGELLLGNLLRDILPPEHYALQYGFKSGERVDAVVRAQALIPVDAKFPLDNFSRLVEAQDDAERELGEKAFARDVRGHIDAVSKYIRPDEGTYDFAFMYLPSEAIYYELTCGKTGELLRYAHEKRVLPVSPTTFTAYLQVIVLGLKGLQIEQHAQEVMAYCAQLQKDFGKFKEDFALVGKHLGNAQERYGDAEKRLDRFETKLERATDSVVELEAGETVAELPRAVDAA